MRACIASLLEIPIEGVLDFHEGSYLDIQEWLKVFGLFYLEIPLPPERFWYAIPGDAMCILLGDTKAGVKHAIVGICRDDQFIPIFNPLPGADISGVSAVGFIIPSDPAAYFKK